jgi:hypothetical protein
MTNLKIVERIQSLPWERLETRHLISLMQISRASAIEFAEALRITLSHYPDNQGLLEMAAGELQTDNLKFGGYNRRGDHSEFLSFFLQGISPNKEIESLTFSYQHSCSILTPGIRIASILSREEDLPSIFARLLLAKGWNEIGNLNKVEQKALMAFRYYLETHIMLDTQEETGHAALLESITPPADAAPFWELRLQLYESFFRHCGLQ